MATLGSQQKMSGDFYFLLHGTLCGWNNFAFVLYLTSVLYGRYVKGYDPGNWLIIDPKTGDIRLNKLPDRESKYLINGTYQAKVLAISEGRLFLT